MKDLTICTSYWHMKTEDEKWTEAEVGEKWVEGEEGADMDRIIKKM